jgi:hypothetical protein
MCGRWKICVGPGRRIDGPGQTVLQPVDRHFAGVFGRRYLPPTSGWGFVPPATDRTTTGGILCSPDELKSLPSPWTNGWGARFWKTGIWPSLPKLEPTEEERLKDFVSG